MTCRPIYNYAWSKIKMLFSDKWRLKSFFDLVFKLTFWSSKIDLTTPSRDYQVYNSLQFIQSVAIISQTQNSNANTSWK